MATPLPTSRDPVEEKRKVEENAEPRNHNGDVSLEDGASDRRSFTSRKVGELAKLWHRFNGRGKRHVGLAESLKVIAISSCESWFLAVAQVS
jgi:hypothetical protein